MTSLITGIGGMVGSHLADSLLNKKDTVYGTFFKPTVAKDDIPCGATKYECDIRYFSNVHSIIRDVLPDRIFHLAAQSYPTVSLMRPQETMEINATGTVNVFESIKLIRNNNPDYNPVVVVACSSAEYGESLLQLTEPVKEEAPLLPLHPYGVSKVTQDLLTYQYYKSDGLNGIRARIFNTTGPRKVNDVCADFTKRIVRMEYTGDRILKVGNIDTKRAITDVRDLVNALILLSEKGKYGEVYNISGEFVYRISEVIDIIRKHTSIYFTIETDPALLRPTDEPIIVGNSDKLKQTTGWKQTWKLEETIKDMLDYWRNRPKGEIL
jgi:nucleoside-diphosphate-sugar epimerase